jgi:hypothetical protein
MLYDTYTSLYNWYYGISIDNRNKEEVATRVIEMDEDGEVLNDNIVNTTTDGEKIIPTISISEIKTITEGAVGTESKDGEGAEGAEGTEKTIAEYVKQYVVETNYRLRGKKKHNR